MADEQTTEEVPKKKKSMMKLIIIAVVVIAVIGGGAAGALMMMGGGETEETDEPEQTDVTSYGMVVELDEFTVNLNDESGQRYLRVRIGLELADETLAEQIDQRQPLIRDAILLLLSSLQMSDINSVEAKDHLKEEITQRVEEFLHEGAILRVLFAEFLVQ